MIIRTCDSVTRLDESAKGSVIVTGSHGGLYPATFVARLRSRGAVFNDASVGKDRAGVLGLELLDNLGIPAAAVGHLTAVIGDGQSTLSGEITEISQSAFELGCRPGDRGSQTAALFSSKSPFGGVPPSHGEVARTFTFAGVQVRLYDSASLVSVDDKDSVVVTGSHGGLLGGDPATALKYPTAGAVFNDAGCGPGGRGISRLAVLASKGIPAVTVDSASARIGDATSTWNQGVISVVNRSAARLGVSIGCSAQDFVEAIAPRESS